MAAKIYLDNGNFTYPAPEVIEIICASLRDKYGIPRAEIGHDVELEAFEVLWKAREIIARSINATPEEIIFTSGTSESNNLAIKGYMRWYRKRAGTGKILTTRIERRCIMLSCERMKEYGHEVEYIDVDSEGKIKEDNLSLKIKSSSLISTHHANHEIGVVQDIYYLSDIAEDNKVVLHIDATHSYLRENIDVEKLSIDLLTLPSHTIHGPLGVGALYIREGLKIEPLIEGDSLEFGIRAGPQNLPIIIGFAKAVELYTSDHVEKLRIMQERLCRGLLEIESTYLNGPSIDSGRRVCDNVNVSFLGVEGEAFLLMCNSKGLVIRTGSACYSESLEPSYVIRALGKSTEYANGSARFTLSRYNTLSDIEEAVKISREVVENLRKISPLWRKADGKV